MLGGPALPRRRRRAAGRTARACASSAAPPRAARAAGRVRVAANSAWCSASAASISSSPGSGFALGQHELPRRLALGERPVGDAVLGDEPRRDLRDAHAILRVARRRAWTLTAVPACAGTTALRWRGTRQKQLVAQRPRRAGRARPAPGVPASAHEAVAAARAGGNSAKKYSVTSAAVVAQARSRRLTRTAITPSGVGERLFRHALQRLLHVADPDRQRGDAAGLVVAERLAAGRSRSTRRRRSTRCSRRTRRRRSRWWCRSCPRGPCGRATARASRCPNATTSRSMRRHDERVARIDRALGALARDRRLRFGEHVALGVGDPRDEVRRDAIAAVGEDRVRAAICSGVAEPAPSPIVRYGGCCFGSKPKRVM